MKKCVCSNDGMVLTGKSRSTWGTKRLTAIPSTTHLTWTGLAGKWDLCVENHEACHLSHDTFCALPHCSVCSSGAIVLGKHTAYVFRGEECELLAARWKFIFFFIHSFI